MPDAGATLTGLPEIEIDGLPLSDTLVGLLQEVIVDDHLQLPDSFEIRFFDPGRNVIGDTRARVGSTVSISVGAPDDPMPQVLLAGEVTGIEAEYDEQGGTLVLRGYDKSHRLTRGRQTKAYKNATYSDIAGEVADAAGLTRGTIEDPGTVVDHVPQANQSNWDFLWDLARKIDYQVAVVDGALDFRSSASTEGAPSQGDFDSDNPLQLVFGGGQNGLLSFRPRVSGAGQVSQFQVRGWSASEKKAIVGNAGAGSTAVSALPDDPGSLASSLGDATFVSVDAGPADQGAADHLARRLREQIGSTFAEATGVARGNPRLRAGKAVSVNTGNATFDGNYTLTHTRHVFDLESGYRTHLEVSGRQERSLMGLTGGGGSGTTGGSSRVFGVVVGLVDDIADPANLGRVTLRFPWLGDDYVSDWARVVMLGAGPSRGSVWLPENDDEVLVAFEQGDIRRPIVIGGLWNGVDAPPGYETDGGKQKARRFVSRRGHMITLSDADDSSLVSLSTSDGKLTIVLDETNGELKVTATSGAKVTISAEGDLAIKSQGQLTLQGQMGAELSSSATVKVKGQMLQLNPPA